MLSKQSLRESQAEGWPRTTASSSAITQTGQLLDVGAAFALGNTRFSTDSAKTQHSCRRSVPASALCLCWWHVGTLAISALRWSRFSRFAPRLTAVMSSMSFFLYPMGYGY